ncbi:hypothetical protein CVT25_009787 [Psilocybe cyanescens]|uniref:F-box domain-containing protein n=1 Tax=Psilocybe cyanescens TaxID=93625 RepID=A0A409X895_PSICY|nr:hypothetical protein CVT25_009787 [Psilocybe cyanescens]
MSEDSDHVKVSSSNNHHKKRKVDSTVQYSPNSEQKIPEDEAMSHKTPKTGRKRANRLAALPGMPIDILFEIFGHLHPYDLLKLSRMTKDFRRLLLSRSSMSVWKDSLANVPGLPESFPGMSEVAWINLAFSPQCHICVTSNIRTIEWRFKLRICSKCAMEHLREIAFMPIFAQGALLNAVIPTRRAKRGHVIYLAADFDYVTAEFKAIEDVGARAQYINEKKIHLAKFLEHVERCEQWEKTQVQDRDAELRHLREERLAACSIEKKLVDLGWDEDVTGIAYPDSLARHKLVNRPQRLTERSLYFDHQGPLLLTHAFFNPVWTNIKPGILDFMEEMRRKRLKRKLDALHIERRKISVDALRAFRQSKLTEALLMPGLLDYWQFEPVEEVVNAPADVKVTISSFDNAILQLPELVGKWRKRIDQEMTQIIKAVRGADDEDLYYDENSESYYPKTKKTFPNATLSDDQLSEKLRLASTVFRCQVCRPWYHADAYDDFSGPEVWQPSSLPLFSPHVLGHHCLTSNRSYPHGDWDFYVVPSNKKWSCNNLVLDVSASNCAQEIIKLAGKDPTLATAEDMDGLNLRFLCRLCPKSRSGSKLTDSKEEVQGEQEGPVFPMFDWRAAIRHQYDKHVGKISYTVVRLDELDTEVIIAENDHRLKKEAIWRCIHCYGTSKDDEPPMTINDIERHFAYRLECVYLCHLAFIRSLAILTYCNGNFNFRHRDISSPILDRDYYKDFAAPNIHASSHYNLFIRCLKDGHYILAKSPDHLLNTSLGIDSNSDNDEYRSF